MSWTDEKVEELKRLWAEGVTTGEIGRRLNVSKNSIVGKVHRLGLSGRPSPIKKKDGDNTPAKKASPAEKTPQKAQKKSEPAKAKPQAPSKPAEAKKPEPKAEKKAAPAQTPAPKAAPKQAPEPAKTLEKKDRFSTLTTDEADIKLAQSLEEPRKVPNPKGFVGLTDLDNHTCRWPIGDPKDENFHFCGKKVRSGQTYCEEHALIAYVRPTKK